jgi:nitroreductase
MTLMEPTGQAAEGSTTVGLDDALYGRRSIRQYTAEPVSQADLRALIDAAIHAPNASNDQRWSFTVIRDRPLLDRLSDGAKAHMLTTSLSERYRRSLADATYDVFHGAPALVVISASATDPWAVEDCALASENLMLAAFGRGLGTCWIGFAQRYVETEAGRALLGLPAQSLPVATIVVGHPASAPMQPERAAPEIRWIG